jgi:hypothetical protein
MSTATDRCSTSTDSSKLPPAFLAKQQTLQALQWAGPEPNSIAALQKGVGFQLEAAANYALYGLNLACGNRSWPLGKAYDAMHTRGCEN